MGAGDIPTILESLSLSHFQDFQPISFQERTSKAEDKFALKTLRDSSPPRP